MLKKLHTRHVQGQRTNGPSAGLCCLIILSSFVGKRCKKLSFQSFPKVVWNEGPQGLKIRRWMLAKRVRSTCKAANQEKATRAEQNDPLKGVKELRRRDKHPEPPNLLLQRERGTNDKAQVFKHSAVSIEPVSSHSRHHNCLPDQMVRSTPPKARCFRRGPPHQRVSSLRCISMHIIFFSNESISQSNATHGKHWEYKTMQKFHPTASVPFDVSELPSSWPAPCRTHKARTICHIPCCSVNTAGSNTCKPWPPLRLDRATCWKADLNFEVCVSFWTQRRAESGSRHILCLLIRGTCWRGNKQKNLVERSVIF